MSQRVEDRLRRALEARAEQVTTESLRPSAPTRSRQVRRPFWSVQVLAAAAVTTAIAGAGVYALTSMTGEPAPGPAEPPRFVTRSSCSQERALVDAALQRGGLPADVDGDGATDRVVVALDEQARVTAGRGEDSTCRAFVGVRTAAGTTYSTAMPDVTSSPPPFPPEVVGLPRLGTAPGAEIVVDTQARADGALAQMYTLTDAGLVQVQVPGTDDDTFLVEGGGVTFPYGADCRSNGDLLLSNARPRGRDFEVTQRAYSLLGDRLVEAAAPVTTEVAGEDLVRQFPEFGSPHFGACDGVVPRGAAG